MGTDKLQISGESRTAVPGLPWSDGTKVLPDETLENITNLLTKTQDTLVTELALKVDFLTLALVLFPP